MKTKLILWAIIIANACIWGAVMWWITKYWQLGLMMFGVAFLVTAVTLGLCKMAAD